MRLWLLVRTDDVGYDEAAGYVVRAETEPEAREVASQGAGDYREPKVKWTDPSLSTCVELTADGPSEVILMDFNAG